MPLWKESSRSSFPVTSQPTPSPAASITEDNGVGDPIVGREVHYLRDPRSILAVIGPSCQLEVDHFEEGCHLDAELWANSLG